MIKQEEYTQKKGHRAKTQTWSEIKAIAQWIDKQSSGCLRVHGIIREQTELLYEAFITNLMCLINVLDYLNMCLIKHSEQKSVPWWLGEQWEECIRKLI